MHWKSQKTSHIDFELILTNLPCSDAEALLIPGGCLVLSQHVLECQVFDESAYLKSY